MEVTTKGQATIPQEIRNRLGPLQHTEVEFELAGGRPLPGGSARGHLAVQLLRGSADIRMSTDEILALTRGELRERKHRK